MLAADNHIVTSDKPEARFALPPAGAAPTWAWAMTFDALSLFGLAAVTAMLVFYALEDRSPWFVLAFAAACALGSIYGFLQGAWPFGLVEAIWTGVAVRRWAKVRKVAGIRVRPS